MAKYNPKDWFGLIFEFHKATPYENSFTYYSFMDYIGSYRVLRATLPILKAPYPFIHC